MTVREFIALLEALDERAQDLELYAEVDAGIGKVLAVYETPDGDKSVIVIQPEH
jgi:hypothetical protein